MDISLVKNKVYLTIKGLIKGFFFLLKYNFPPPPLYSDMSGYERLLDMMIKKKIELCSGGRYIYGDKITSLENQ